MDGFFSTDIKTEGGGRWHLVLVWTLDTMLLWGFEFGLFSEFEFFDPQFLPFGELF